MAGDKKLGEIWAISAGPNVDVRAFVVGLTQFRHTVGSEVKQIIPDGLDPQDVSIQNRDAIETIEIGGGRGLTYGQGYPVPPLSEWSPLGGVRPLSFNVSVAPSTLFSAYAQLRAREDAAGDLTVAINGALAQQVSIFRDLTINAGIVLTAGFRLQVVVCRNLIFGSAASRLTALGLGYAGAAGGAPSVGGTFDGQFPAAADLANTLFAAGGTGGVAAGLGGTGTAARTARLLAYLSLISGTFYPYGPIVGGGGGAGNNAAGAGSAGGAGLAGGGQGGGGNAGLLANIAPGGNGGGALLVVCEDVQGFAGIIDADGSPGSAALGPNVGGSGGGGGGFCLVFNKGALTIVPIIRANGGAGGAAGAGAGAGGPGGAGLAAQIALT